MALTTLQQALFEAGYVVGPNNIWNTPGVEMYASGPGIWEPNGYEYEVWVTDATIRIMRFIPEPRNDGSGYLNFIPTVVQEFTTAQNYLSWVQSNGRKSEGGLPAFANSWD